MKFFSTIILSFFVITVFFFLTPRASAHTFLTNLRLGDRGNDVKELQRALNTNAKTQIALSGPGSPGNETDYFGILTKNAILKFQELYRTEILLPVGLSAPTGFVGSLTRLQLNSVSSKGGLISTQGASQISLPTNVKLPTSPSATPSLEDLLKFNTSVTQIKPKILGLSRYEVGRKDIVSIRGQGFLNTENKIHFGNSGLYSTATSSNSMELIFTVPENISYDSYYLWVENKSGSSFVENGKSFFSVSEFPHLPPNVTSISPSSVSIDSSNSIKIKVLGNNFTKAGNDIYSSLGIIEDVASSDGKSLEFPLSDFSRIGEMIALKKSISRGTILIPVVVKTDYGVSSEQVNLVISF